MSSYIFFSNDYRPIVREKDPTLTLPEVSRCLGIAWKSLTTEQRKMYEKRADEDKERYNRDMMVSLWDRWIRDVVVLNVHDGCLLAEKTIVVQWHAIRYLEQFDKVTRMKHTLSTLWVMVMKIKK